MGCSPGPFHAGYFAGTNEKRLRGSASLGASKKLGAEEIQDGETTRLEGILFVLPKPSGFVPQPSVRIGKSACTRRTKLIESGGVLSGREITQWLPQILLANQAAEDLTALGLRKLAHRQERLGIEHWTHNIDELRSSVIQQLRRRMLVEHHEAHNRLTFDLVRHADHRGFQD